MLGQLRKIKTQVRAYVYVKGLAEWILEYLFDFAYSLANTPDNKPITKYTNDA